MNISDIINKSSPLYKQKEMSKSEYKKLVDRNTELIDKMKDLQERINKAIDYINKETRFSFLGGMMEFYGDTDELIRILKGEDKE